MPTATATRTPIPTPTPPPPTLPPQTTRDPSATPNPLQGAGEVLFSDTFDSNTGWGVGSDEASVIGFSAGRLTFTLNKPGLFRLSLWGGPVVQGGLYQVTAETSLCAGRDEYALLFNVQDLNNYYRFSLSCDGLTQAARVRDGNAIPLKDWSPSGSVIRGAPAENTLEVWAAGGTLRFFVNGVYLYTVSDATFPGGVVGLMVRSGVASQSVSVSFDDLTVRAVSP